MNSYARFINPNNPAFELNGYVLTKVPGQFDTKVYLFAPDLFERQVTTHQETGRFVDSATRGLVGYMADFDNDGRFCGAANVYVQETAWFRGGTEEIDTGYNLTTGPLSYKTLKGILSQASVTSPRMRQHNEREEAARRLAVEEEYQRSVDSVKALTSDRQVSQWVYRTRHELADLKREIKVTLQTFEEAATKKLAEIEANPDGYVSDSFLPGYNSAHSRLEKLVALHNEKLRMVRNSPLWPLFREEA